MQSHEIYKYQDDLLHGKRESQVLYSTFLFKWYNSWNKNNLFIIATENNERANRLTQWCYNVEKTGDKRDSKDKM